MKWNLFNILCAFFLSGVILLTCGREKKLSQKKLQKTEKPHPLVNKPQVITPEEKLSKEKKKENIVLKAGIKCRIYEVQKGDNVWIIAKKIAMELKGENYTKRDVGNIFYLINKINFSKYPGGVKNKLYPGEKILVPVELNF